MNPILLLVFLFLLTYDKFSVANEDISLPTGFRLETVVSDLGLATGFSFADGNRIFVTTKDGMVRVVQDGVLQAEPFIDLTSIVNDAGDRGLTDVAVHPDFPGKPYIFVAYVYDPPELAGLSGLGSPDARGRRVSRITRYTANAQESFNKVVPGSELHMVGANSRFDTMGTPNLIRDEGEVACMEGDSFMADCLPSDDYSHVIGSLLFANDGSLYVGNGDGATVASSPLPLTLRSLELDSMAGKILRVNPETGHGYADNPFYDGDPNSNRSKVINYGLRNPYGFTIDPISNSLFMADTGWTSWEELNEGRGRNFGWPCFEGGSGSSNRQPVYAGVCSSYLESQHSVTPALFAYNHENKGGAITGVEIYQGDSYPQQYKGAIFFNDFVRSEVTVVTLSDGQFQGVNSFAAEWPGISKIRRGPDENLYFMDIFSGTLSRLAYGVDASQQPIAKIEATPYYGELPLQVNFSASASHDPSGRALSYYWTFGDGEDSDLAAPQHVYQTAGDFQVTLEITNSVGLKSNAELTVFAGKTPPQIEFVRPSLNDHYKSGEDVVFEASVSLNGADIDSSQVKVVWSATVSEGLEKNISLDLESDFQGRFLFPELHKGTHISLCLLVTMADALTAERCILLGPLLAKVSLDSRPSGLKLSLNDQEVVAPHSDMLHVGSSVTVTANDNKGYSFGSWSNDKSKKQTLIVSESGVTITAVFAKSGGSGALGLGLVLILLGRSKQRMRA